MKIRSVQRNFAAAFSLVVLGAIAMSSGCGQTASQPGGTTMTDSMKSDGMMQDGMMKDGMMKDGMTPAAGEMKSDKKM